MNASSLNEALVTASGKVIDGKVVSTGRFNREV